MIFLVSSLTSGLIEKAFEAVETDTFESNLVQFALQKNNDYNQAFGYTIACDIASECGITIEYFEE